MSYCSFSDIISTIPNDALIQLTNDYGGKTVMSDKITEAINYTDNIIDGYLRGRYNLPLSSTPDELKYIAIDFTVYRLYSRRHYGSVPENIKERYSDVEKRIKEIQNGTYSLGIEDTDEISNILMKTNKTSVASSVNKYYDDDKWNEYDSWENYDD